jgi:hypothetical protein
MPTRPPRRWRERVGYETVRASRDMIVPRTVAEIAACSGPGSRLVVNARTPSASVGLGRLVAALAVIKY